MKPVPKASQPSAPGVRLVSGRLLNQICEAIQARTPLNAELSTTQGHAGATKEAAAKAPAAKVPPRFDAGRTYVLPGSTVKRLADDLRARMQGGGVTRGAPTGATAAGLEALLRAITASTPGAFDTTSAAGYRMPVTPARTARLVIEWEIKTVYADLCGLEVRMDDEAYLTKQTSVNVYEHGTQTLTTTAAGNVRTWTYSTAPTDCDAPVYANDYIPGYDYGDLVSSDYTEETTPFADVWDAAVAALAGTTATTPFPADFTWPEDEWAAKTAPGGWSYGLGNIGTWKDLDVPGLLYAMTYRWRVKNTGQAHIKLFWERRLESDASVLASGSLNIGRGRTSGWQEPPATPADPADRMYATLAAIQLGPYR